MGSGGGRAAAWSEVGTANELASMERRKKERKTASILEWFGGQPTIRI